MGDKKSSLKKIEKGIELILEGLGIDWKNDENFKETPRRVARMYIEITEGLFNDFNDIKVFKSNYDGIIALKDVKAVGICPHHLLPIEYSISFGYIPRGKVLGLSKIVRFIRRLAARPVLQEDLTKELVNYFVKKIKPFGVAVVVEGIHGCMKYRGVKEGVKTKTAELYGAFFDDIRARQEFYKLIEK